MFGSEARIDNRFPRFCEGSSHPKASESTGTPERRRTDGRKDPCAHNQGLDSRAMGGQEVDDSGDIVGFDKKGDTGNSQIC